MECVTYIKYIRAGETVEAQRGPDDTWEPLWPSNFQVHCSDFKCEKPAASTSAATIDERGDDFGAPVQQVKRRPQDAIVDSILDFLKTICVSPPKSSCRTLQWVNGPVAS